MSAARLEKLDYRNRPSTPAEKGPKPLCHGATQKAIDKYLDEFETFLKAYREASVAYRGGRFDVEFPRGSFRPPLIEACG